MSLEVAPSWQKSPPYSQSFGRDVSAIHSDDDGNDKAAAASNDEHHNYHTSNSNNNNNNNNEVHYQASCHCGRVQYEVIGDPLNAKLCHCRGCQKLHGAPLEWVAVFAKDQVRFPTPTSLEHLYFYSSALDQGWTSVQAPERILPVKVSCSHCRTPIADEGRNMWLAFATLFGFTEEGEQGIPESFRHSCHLFYNQRCIHIPDDKTKWHGHRNQSPEWKPS
ncbi:hypothetical protein ACA910_016221 [Epithemia clementina (nom. ined.)]